MDDYKIDKDKYVYIMAHNIRKECKDALCCVCSYEKECDLLAQKGHLGENWTPLMLDYEDLVHILMDVF